MKAAAWQELFHDKGWLDGERVVAPAGSALYIQFAERKGSLAIQCLADPRQEVAFNDTFLIERNKDPRGEWQDEIYYLWDDVASVRMVEFTD